ncbi:DMT family transporter [Aliiroseovarius crassostreae]|uniref:DMT family transporter n=1 Tax=Aliiroseovarius crassostreae TaxID=154981 RepID=UPI003C7DE04E
MRLFALTAVTMLAFAANSILNRAAIAEAAMDPVIFALIRVLSGAVVLAALVALRGVFKAQPIDIYAVLGLVAYLLGFSFAYQDMDAGLGALILFGGVQITMFAGALRGGEAPGWPRWVGAGMALAGLAFLLWPSDAIHLTFNGFMPMSIAAIGWGVYSLIGRKSADPLAATCWNFIYATPFVALGLLFTETTAPPSAGGLWLAILSGAVTSGLGYALWYAVLPGLGATRAALAQLSVPVIAIGLGVVLLGEVLALQSLLSAGLVLVGITVGVFSKER